MAQVEVVYGTRRKLSDPEYPGAKPTTHDLSHPSSKNIRSPLGIINLVVAQEKVSLMWDGTRSSSSEKLSGTRIRSSLVDLARVVTR